MASNSFIRQKPVRNLGICISSHLKSHSQVTSCVEVFWRNNQKFLKNKKQLDPKRKKWKKS